VSGARLSIVRVMPFFSDRYGGPVVQARLVCKELAARGHRLRVISSDLGLEPTVPREEWLDRDGYRVWHGRAGLLQRRPPYPAGSLRPAIEAALSDTDVLCLNVGLTMLNDTGRRLARSRGVPYVYNAEGALCPDRLRVKRLAKRAFLRLVERPLLREAAALQAVSARERDDLIRQGAAPARITVVPNGVAEPPPVTGAERAAVAGDVDTAGAAATSSPA